jgi:hypothetical protein
MNIKQLTEESTLPTVVLSQYAVMVGLFQYDSHTEQRC